MQQATAKLHGVPSLIAAARANLKNPPRVFVERATTMFRGASDLLGHDLPLAFAEAPDAARRTALPGKLAAFTLRRDYQAARGSDFSLREFHERVMTNGIAPWWAHRQLLLPGDRRPVIE